MCQEGRRPEAQQAQQHGRHVQGEEGVAGAPGSGEQRQRQRQQVGSNRHLGSRASGAGCPFLITGRAQSGEVGRGVLRFE